MRINPFHSSFFQRDDTDSLARGLGELRGSPGALGGPPVEPEPPPDTSRLLNHRLPTAVFPLRPPPTRLIQPHEDYRLDIQRVALNHDSECVTECAKP